MSGRHQSARVHRRPDAARGREPDASVRAAPRARAVRDRSGPRDRHLAVARLDAPRRGCARRGSSAIAARGRNRSTRLVAERCRPPSEACLDEIAALRRPDARGRSARGCASSTPSSAGDCPSVADELERDYSPGRTWQSLAVGHRGPAAPRRRARRRLGRRRRGGCAGALLPLAHLHRHERAPDRRRRASASRASRQRARAGRGRARAAVRGRGVRLGPGLPHADVRRAPGRASLEECARVLRPGGRVVVLCLDEHEQREVTARYGERHPGFSPRACAACSRAPASTSSSAEVAAAKRRSHTCRWCSPSPTSPTSGRRRAHHGTTTT